MAMKILFWILVLWLASSFALLIALYRRTILALWREPVLARPVVIIESDDWGVGPASDANMLGTIAELLGRVRDDNGHPAVMTLGLVLGQPDGASILASGGTRYRRKTLLDSEFASIVAAIEAGCQSGVFSLQWHGLEHCWPASLLCRAKQEESLRAWLADPASRSETLPSFLQSRWIDTSVLPSRKLSRAEVEAAISEERALFEVVFGRTPAIAVPNTFVWDDSVEQAWSNNGVQGIVTSGRRYEGRDGQGRLTSPTRIIRNGDHSGSGASYFVRDEYFEPARGHRAERAWEAVERKTALGRPTLLETHRENFVLSEDDARQSLSELDRFLKGVLARHSDVQFISVESLLEQLKLPNAPILQHSLSCRFEVFLGRLRDDTTLARFLKFSGCGATLALVSRVLASVTRCPSSKGG